MHLILNRHFWREISFNNKQAIIRHILEVFCKPNRTTFYLIKFLLENVSFKIEYTWIITYITQNMIFVFLVILLVIEITKLITSLNCDTQNYFLNIISQILIIIKVYFPDSTLKLPINDSSIQRTNCQT